MKKIFTLLMCLVMALGIVTTAYAEEMTGSITIENAIEKQSYYIYRIFNLESFNAEENAYSYTVNETWSDFAHDDGIRGHYITLEEKSGSTYVKWIEGANVNEFANLAIKWAKEKNIFPDDGWTVKDAGNYTFENLKLGYYLVDSSVGAICSLDTTNPNVTMKEKNSLTTVEKKVQENSTQDFGKENNASIGETVKFKSEISVGKGAENLVLHDKMDETLIFNNDVVVRMGSETISGDNYTVSTETTDGCTFEVKFNDKFSASLNENTKLLVEYSAVLGSNAKIHNVDAESNESANRNETWVSFGDDLTSTHSATNTWTYEFDLVKTNQDNKIIKGATFYLYNSETDGDIIPLVKVGEGVYRVATDQELGLLSGDERTKGVLIEAGKVSIQGLDEAVYYLGEQSAPAGYNKLSGRVAVTIGKQSNKAVLNGDRTAYISGGVQVINKSGTELPTTGGMGTRLFYIIGGLMLALSAVLFVKKRYMN